jgi:hypothetical protein
LYENSGFGLAGRVVKAWFMAVYVGKWPNWSMRAAPYKGDITNPGLNSGG